MSTSVLKALPGKRDIKRHSPSILYVTFAHTETQQHTDRQTDVKRQNGGVNWAFDAKQCIIHRMLIV